jgi:hypothetical protein
MVGFDDICSIATIIHGEKVMQWLVPLDKEFLSQLFLQGHERQPLDHYTNRDS